MAGAWESEIKMSQAIESDDNWNIIITSKRKLLDLRLKEVWHYKYLIWLFIKRDFAVAYKQTILGPLWYVLQPLASTIMYAFVFGGLAGIGTDGVPSLLFYYGGNMLWTYFTSCLNSAASTFSANSNIFSKVYFPRLTVPISTTIGHVVKLGIQAAMLACFYIYYLIIGQGVHPTWYALLIPLLIPWIGAMGTGLGLIISSLTTKYRDLNMLLSFGLSLAMYATPIVYPLSQAPEKYKWIFYINPMSAPVELWRMWLYNAGSLPVEMSIISLLMTVVFLFFGLILFTHNERTFVDVI